jgi:RNA polymerase primary sigma factor
MAKAKAAVQPEGDAPVIDLNQKTIKKLITQAKKRGYLTYDELNETLPQDKMSSEQIEDIMSALSEMGVNIVENEDVGEEEAAEAKSAPKAVDGSEKKIMEPPKAKTTSDRTDDPVRMYLREMGAVELLSREGEIAIAKRIEAGRDMMIMGLCESPITFNAIIEWSDALNNEEMQLREILDLEAMLTKGPSVEEVENDDDSGEISEKTAGVSIKDDDDEFDDDEESSSDDSNEEESEEGGSTGEARRREEDDDDDNQLSLDALGGGDEFKKAQETRYQNLRLELTAEVESVQFHATKIEYLVDQLYSYNRRLTALGGQMLRLAERHKVPRKSFIENYMSRELEENWLKKVAKIDKKWEKFASTEAEAVDRIRTEISEISQATGRRLNEKRGSPKRRWWKPISGW